MDFRTDGRGAATTIGFVLIFGIVILALAGYQSVAVPSQNAQVEFNHFERVGGDMLDFRNEYWRTSTTGQIGFASVEMGTTYPARILTVNPGPPSGTLRTSDPRQVQVVASDGTDVTADVCPIAVGETALYSQSLGYEPAYNAFSGGAPIRYENSVVYLDYRAAPAGGDVVFRSGQRLVRGDVVTLVPLEGDVQYATNNPVALDLEAGLVDSSERSDVTLMVPTELDERHWEDLLKDEVDPSQVVVTNGTLSVTLQGTYTIDCGPIGVDGTPGAGSRGSDTADINPASPGQISLLGASTQGSTLTMYFNNSGGENALTRGRINFYEDQGNGPGSGDIFASPDAAAAGDPSGTLVVGDDYTTLDPGIVLDGEATSAVVIEFDRNVNNQDWFVVTFTLRTGEDALYFVSVSGYSG